MKNLFSSGLIRSGVVASFAFAASARAADVYWNNTSLTWSTATATWNTAADGTGTTQNWNNGDNAVFSAGTALTAQYNITNGGVVVDNITQEEGRVRLQNSTLMLADTAMVINTQARVSGDYDIRIDSVIADSGAGASAITKNGAGIVMLTGGNTFTGGFVLNNGTVAIETQNSAFGTGTLTLNGGYLVKSFGATVVTLANAINVTGTTGIAVVDQGANNDVYFTGAFTGTGTFQVDNSPVNGMNIRNASIKVMSDISGFQGTFKDNQTATRFNRLRFGPAAAGDFGVIDGSHAKFVLSGITTSTGAQVDLGDAAYGIFKLGELSGTGGFLTVGWNTPSGITTLEIGALNTSSTFAGVIGNNGTGVAAVRKVGTGTLILAGNNTWTGITTISAGILQVGSGGATGTIGTNGVVNNGALVFNRDATTNLAVSGVISGSGSVTQAGTGRTILSGANTYTGDTTVTAGTLEIDNAVLADVSAVRVSTGATLNLNHALTDTVDKFYIDGALQTSGTWGAVGSGATHTTSLITGTGILQVTTGGAPYANWASAKGLAPGVNDGISQDPDNDGRINIGEFAFDGNPLSGANDGRIVSKVAMVGGQNVLTLTIPVRNGAIFPDVGGDELVSMAQDGVVYHIQGSLDLGTWTGNFINVDEVTSPADVSAVQGTLPTDKPLDGGWAYRSFFIPGSDPAGNVKMFIRAIVSAAP